MQISFAVTAKLISAFVFATRIVQSLFFLNQKFQVSSLLLCLYRPVCAKLLVFSCTGSLFSGLKECNAGADEKRKMMDILSRLEKETAEDEETAIADDDADDLHERLQDLDLERDADKIWCRLTDKVSFYNERLW